MKPHFPRVFGTKHGTGGWTLIEIMVVVAILGIVLTMGIPTIYQLRKKEGMRQTVADIVEVCSNARAQAILSGRTVELYIRPQDRRLDVTTPAAPRRSSSTSGALSPFEALPEPISEPETRPRSGLSAQVPENLYFDMVDVNFVEYKDAELARVRFYANGTCDELTIVLRSDQNEFRKIALEVTTSLAMVEILGNK